MRGDGNIVRFLKGLGLEASFVPHPLTSVSRAAIDAFATAEGIPPSTLTDLIEEAHAGETATSADGRLAALRVRGGVVVTSQVAADTVLHEVRNAVTSVAGWARIAAREGGATERGDQALAAIESAALAAMDAASPRSLSKLARPLSIASLASQARELVEPLARERRVEIRVDTSPALLVTLSRSALLSALSNLLKNAIEASQPGDTVCIEAARQDGDVDIRVSNPSHGARLPVPGHSTKGPGRGLGLRLVHRIASEAEGTLHFVEGPAASIVAVLRLPADDSFAEPAPTKAKRTTAIASGTRPAARARAAAGGFTQVLVIDDETSIRNLVTTALTMSGMTAIGVAGPEELSEGQHFEIALVDLRLGDRDGLEVARSLVANRVVHRVVLMTGAPLGDRPRDVLAVVRKPFDLDELTEQLREWTAPAAHGRSMRG